MSQGDFKNRQGERQIQLQPRDRQNSRSISVKGKDPYAQARNLVRAMMVVGDTPKVDHDDGLYPTHWAATAYDSMKYSQLREKLAGVLDKMVEGGANLVGAPLRAVLDLAQRSSGIPVADLIRDPAQLEMALNALSGLPDNMDMFSGHVPSQRGEFMPRGYTHGSVASMSKEEFMEEHREEFRKIGEEVQEKLALFGRREPNAIESVGNSLKNLATSVGNSSVGEYAGKAVDYTRENPEKVIGGVAALGAAGMGLRRLLKSRGVSKQHQSAFQEALDLFPDLQKEDPKKIQLLWSSAVHVAPTMATNPLLLGTWMKGLAQSYADTHLSTQDLKQLQDLEVGHTGQRPRQQGPMDQFRDIAQTGSSLVDIMSKIRQGQAKGKK